MLVAVDMKNWARSTDCCSYAETGARRVRPNLWASSGGISGIGAAPSAIRDLVLRRRGPQAPAGFLERPLVQLYLYSMTRNVLAGGDNSNMSVLEELAKVRLGEVALTGVSDEAS